MHVFSWHAEVSQKLWICNYFITDAQILDNNNNNNKTHLDNKIFFLKHLISNHFKYYSNCETSVKWSFDILLHQLFMTKGNYKIGNEQIALVNLPLQMLAEKELILNNRIYV